MTMCGNHPCQARQHSDQMICSKCGLLWDINDPDPPECQRHTLPEKSTKRRTDNQEKQNGKSAP